MNKYLTKAVSLLCAAVLAVSFSACGKEPVKETNWGELCRRFDAAWFEALPEEMQSQYDNLALGEAPEKTNPANITGSSTQAPVSAEEGTDAIAYAYGFDDAYLYDEELQMQGKLTSAIAATQKENTLDYEASVTGLFLEEPAKLSVVIALSDAKTGEYLEAKTLDLQEDLGAEGKEQWTASGSFEKTKKNGSYKIEMLALVEPAQGLKANCPLYISQEVKPA